MNIPPKPPHSKWTELTQRLLSSAPPSTPGTPSTLRVVPVPYPTMVLVDGLNGARYSITARAVQCGPRRNKAELDTPQSPEPDLPLIVVGWEERLQFTVKMVAMPTDPHPTWQDCLVCLYLDDEDGVNLLAEGWIMVSWIRRKSKAYRSRARPQVTLDTITFAAMPVLDESRPAATADPKKLALGKLCVEVYHEVKREACDEDRSERAPPPPPPPPRASPPPPPSTVVPPPSTLVPECKKRLLKPLVVRRPNAKRRGGQALEELPVVEDDKDLEEVPVVEELCKDEELVDLDFVAKATLQYAHAAQAMQCGVPRTILVQEGLLPPLPPPCTVDLVSETDDTAEAAEGEGPPRLLVDPYPTILQRPYDASEYWRLTQKYLHHGHTGLRSGGAWKTPSHISHYPQVERSLIRCYEAGRKRKAGDEDGEDEGEDRRHVLTILRQIEYYEIFGCVHKQPLPWSNFIDVDDEDPVEVLVAEVIRQQERSLIDVDAASECSSIRGRRQVKVELTSATA